MGIFDRYQKKQRPAPPDPRDPNSIKEARAAYEAAIEGHRQILDYFRRLESGGQLDPTFEQLSLNNDLGFNSLDLAEIIFAISKEYEIPIDRIVHFLSIGLPGGGDQALALLLRRIATLADSFSTIERMALLDSGVVGDRKEILPINSMFDSVGFIIKYCRAVIFLKDQTDHEAPDLEYGEVEEDRGWE
jgi:hypothetical protein